MSKRKLHNLLITGGAGFIGSNFIHYLFNESASNSKEFTDSGFTGNVVNIDLLTYAGNLENLKAGTLGDPADPVTLLRYWQCQERAHYPNARENVEYFTNALREEQTGGVINEEKNLWQLY